MEKCLLGKCSYLLGKLKQHVLMSQPQQMLHMQTDFAVINIKIHLIYLFIEDFYILSTAKQ